MDVEPAYNAVIYETCKSSRKAKYNAHVTQLLCRALLGSLSNRLATKAKSPTRDVLFFHERNYGGCIRIIPYFNCEEVLRDVQLKFEESMFEMAAARLGWDGSAPAEREAGEEKGERGFPSQRLRGATARRGC